MESRKPIVQVLIPHHFGHRWDIIPERTGDWTVINCATLSARLLRAYTKKPDLLVSGDCMAAIAAHRTTLPLIWFDAHGDFHTLATTMTGSIGGMPLAMLLGHGDQTFMKLCGNPAVAFAIHVGGTEFDPGEAEEMSGQGVRVCNTLASAPKGNIHLHVDTDVISCNEMPSSIHPAPHGMPLEVFWQQMDLLLPKTEVLSIKSYDPRLDVSGKGQRVVLELIRRFNDCRANPRDE